MAKTLEELKEAIQNVIAENDKGEITATALQTILLDMSETLSELGSSGGGQFDIYATIDMSNEENPVYCTEEQKELNKQVYDKIAAGERCPLVVHTNDILDFPIEGAKINLSSTCIYIMFMSNIPDDMMKDLPVETKGILQFMWYGATMFGFNAFILVDSGDIFIESSN